MYHARTLIFLLLAVLVAAGNAYPQELAAPEEVSHAAVVHYRIKDAEQGDQVRWLLLNPFPAGDITQITTDSGMDFIVDPPIGFSGLIRVQAIVVSSDGVMKTIEVAQTYVKPSDKVIPEPESDDDSKEVDSYDGPNNLGIGEVSYENAPKYSAEVVDLINRAAGYVKGYPSVKVIGTPDTGSHGETYLLFNWLNKEMAKHPEFSSWYVECVNHMKSTGMDVGTPTDKWYQYFIEMADGLQHRKVAK
jgi:hypothetical protein